MPKRRKGTGVPFSWGMKDRDAGGQFAGKTDRVTGSQRPLSVQAETGTHEMGNGSRRVTAESAEIREWRERVKPEFGGVRAAGGIANEPLPRKPALEAKSLYVQDEETGESSVKPEALNNPSSVNRDNARLSTGEEREATRQGRERGYQTGLF